MKRVLSVGFEEFGLSSKECLLENGGLGRIGVVPNPASALYDYDVIIINPASYSHFIFGGCNNLSGKSDELIQLKKLNGNFDFASVLSWRDRENELRVAAHEGATIVWCLSAPFRQNFFGYRTTYMGYLSDRLANAVEGAGVVEKLGRRIGSDAGIFPRYFSSLRQHGWRMALEHGFEGYRSVGATPEKYSLAGAVESALNGWLVTPPSHAETASALISDAIKLPKQKPLESRYHGIFICHSSADKPFVRTLRDRLVKMGVSSVWVDEAEIKIGDSLTSKIQSAIENNSYVGVVLSPDSVQSTWVKREMAMGLSRENTEGKTVVVPILHRDCEVPLILRDKVYADFRSPDRFDAELGKILSRLED